MENKLKMELDALPTPATAFEELEAMQTRPKTFRLRKRMVVVLAAVLALLLCGMGWAKTSMSYGMWVLYSSGGWSDVEGAAVKFDIQLPETMDGVPFETYSVYGHVPQDGSWLRACLSPLYVPRSVDYAVWESREITLPDGSTTLYTYTVEDFGLDFGSTANEIWRVYFNMDENGVWTGCEVPESYYTVEYKGITLQIGDTIYYSEIEGRDVYTRWVHWVDEKKEVAFSLNETDYEDPDRVVECAKAIIDLNS